MDFISAKIDRKIELSKQIGDLYETSALMRAKLEYNIVLLTAFLWGRNFETIDRDDKEYILPRLIRPSIGSLVEIARKLDADKFFEGAKILRILEKYPSLRNDVIGHGQLFSDGLDSYVNALREINDALFSDKTPFFSQHFDIIRVIRQDNNVFVGMNFKSNGYDILGWRHQINDYLAVGSNYYINDKLELKLIPISPFVSISNENDAAIFKEIRIPAMGLFRYMKLFETGNRDEKFPNFTLEVATDGTKRTSANGTLMNNFKANYRNYIDTGIVKRITKFLTQNRASAIATIWGHGGVGKTATVQKTCEDLFNNEKKYFDWIIFLSAKDRYFDYQSGKISPLSQQVSSYDDVIKSVSEFLEIHDQNPEIQIAQFDGQILIVIDDFETFTQSDRERFEEFSKSLDINHHKLLFTTRANVKLGEEIQTNELNIEESAQFIENILTSDYGWAPSPITIQQKNSIYSATGGRPLFLFQLAYLITQRGNMEYALSIPVKSSKDAVDFLYGRLYEYLSENSKNLFCCIGLIVNTNDLTSTLKQLQYIANMENDPKFDECLSELSKLKIIDILENNFFMVYSKEILDTMKYRYGALSDSAKGFIGQRVRQLGASGNKDINNALLDNANAARYNRQEPEVVSLYRQILNREGCQSAIKLQALLNLSDYLFNARGKKDEAIRCLEEFELQFFQDPIYIKMTSTYLWSIKMRKKAIDVLSDFFARSAGSFIGKSIRFELLGLLAMYRSIYAIDEKEELKSRYKDGEIGPDEYKRAAYENKIYMKDIYGKQGHTLLNEIRNLGDNVLSSAAIQNVSLALHHLINIGIRINHTDFAIEACELALGKYTPPGLMKYQVQRRLEQLRNGDFYRRF